MTSCPLDQPYRGGFVGAEHHFALTVYFEDTDTAGIVYYANYLKFMERARSDMIRAAGVDQTSEHHSGGGAYAVAEVSIRYVKPARLGDDLVERPAGRGQEVGDVAGDQPGVAGRGRNVLGGRQLRHSDDRRRPVLSDCRRRKQHEQQ